MSIFQWLGAATLVVASVAGSACEREAAEAKNDVGVAIDETKEGVEDAADATKEGAAEVIDDTQDAVQKTADAGQNIAEKTVDKTKEIASATGEAITDGWITTRIHSEFVDEALLKGSDIDVDTQDHVVTLKGTVKSDPARQRAAAIARSTEGVNQVVNRLVVDPK